MKLIKKIIFIKLKRNISVCQNCGRYYLQYSAKEVYCDLPNLDGSPTCKTYASRKAYDSKIEEDLAELTYKREYQRRITKVYRSDKIQKEQTKNEFLVLASNESVHTDYIQWDKIPNP